MAEPGELGVEHLGAAAATEHHDLAGAVERCRGEHRAVPAGHRVESLGPLDAQPALGLLGEIGTAFPLTENERKVLRAAIIAQCRGVGILGVPEAVASESG